MLPLPGQKIKECPDQYILDNPVGTPFNIIEKTWGKGRGPDALDLPEGRALRKVIFQLTVEQIKVCHNITD